VKNLTGLTLMALCVALLTACSSRPLSKAPVEDRGTSRPAASASRTTPAVATPGAVPATSPEVVKPLRGLENLGKPGFHTVQRGDTLIRIALDNGQNWRDVARWNNLDNPSLIEVGEVLRVVPPQGDGVVARPITAGGAVPAPLGSGSPIAAGTLPPAGGVAATPAVPAASAASPSTSSAPAAVGGDEMAWIWPARGATLAGFDELKNKGVDIAGRAGDPVLAAADGRVVYAGSGLRGYGNLVILKHNNTYLTAYAHNQSLLVKEDQTVKQGQKIAEMGSTDADRVKLHFEIRRQGKPVDPARYLPAR
jgi:lipoprotein NlpD